MEIKTFVERIVREKIHWRAVKTQFPNEYQTIVQKTSFLPTNIQPNARYYCILNNILSHPLCKTCGEPVEWTRLMSKGFKIYCNTTCKNLDPTQQLKNKQGVKDKYGVEHIGQVPQVISKRYETNLKKYGTKHPAQLAHFKEKTKQTNLKKYGAEHALKLKEFFDKVKQTNLEKYGHEYIQQVPDFKEKTKQTNLEKYGTYHFQQQHISANTLENLNNKNWLYEQHYAKKKSLSQIAQELDFNDMTTISRYLHNHGLETQYHFQSTGERQLNDFINSLGIHTQTNTRLIINPLEIDIFIPSHNIAIEYCGLYWHSEQQGKNKWYHRNKFELCKEKNIQLLTIFEDEWVDRQDQVKAKLKSLLGRDDRQRVYARNTKIVEISTKTKKVFFEQNHIQGDGPGSVNLGLLHDNKLVACMSFIKQKNDIFYLNRYATSGRVVGGFSKLLKYFKEHYQWNQIISFADLRWSCGNLYEKCGFELIGIIPPDYFYIRHNKRIHKFNYRRKNLPKLLKHFNPNLSEKQNCDINGVLRVWDCGKVKFVIKN